MIQDYYICFGMVGIFLNCVLGGNVKGVYKKFRRNNKNSKNSKNTKIKKNLY